MIAIIDYGLGNLASILNMHRYLGIPAEITSNPKNIESAYKLILPGVGNFQRGMENLHNSGLLKLLDNEVNIKNKPILGICLGAQLMTKHSMEGNLQGLGWVNAKTIRFRSEKIPGLKVPHMGWSEINVVKNSPLLIDLPANPRFYHVHSFHFDFEDGSQVLALSKHGYEFPSAFSKDNIYGTQFHPEKSHKFGMKVLQNFSRL